MNFDTLGLAQDLERAGFSEQQARGLARALRDHLRGPASTTADLRTAAASLQDHVFEARHRPDRIIANAETRLTKVMNRPGNRFICWMAALMIPIYAMLVAIIIGLFSR